MIIGVGLLNAAMAALNMYFYASSGEPLNLAAAIFSAICAIGIFIFAARLP